MDRWDQWRLRQARRWEPRLAQHPWIWALPIPVATVVIPVLANLGVGQAGDFNLTSNLVAAPFTWLFFRWFMPRANRWNLARLERRFSSQSGT